MSKFSTIKSLVGNDGDSLHGVSLPKPSLFKTESSPKPKNHARRSSTVSSDHVKSTLDMKKVKSQKKPTTKLSGDDTCFEKPEKIDEECSEATKEEAIESKPALGIRV